MTDKKALYKGEFLNVVRTGHWEYVERTSGKDVVYIIPIVENKWGESECVFIREFRIPFQKHVVGFPAGLVGDTDDTEDIRMAAQRELLEEVGYEAGALSHVTSGASSSGLSNETIHFFLAEKLTKVNEGGGDDSEDIEVIKVPLYKAESWLEAQSKKDIIDVKSYIGLYFANQWC